MSKEQTPITAEEFLDKDEFVNVKGFIKESGTLKTTTSLMEQYANAKVLEALEREFSQVAIFDKNGKSKIGIDYFKTEVKPKYEL